MESEEIIEHIINGISDFKIIPFFGSGMSRSCGIPDWKGVIEELKKELNSTEDNFLIVAQEYENKYGRDILIHKLQAICELKEKNSGALKNHLRILAMNPPIIYTTNYDNAIEEAALLLFKEYKKIVTLKDIVESQHGENQIIKFHGDFNDKENIVFTRNDYNQRLNLEKHPLDVSFRSHILGKSVLFLGYSFGDENIQLIFDMHKELYGAENIPRSYIVSFERDLKKEDELKKKNVITLVLDSPDELSNLINEISAKVFNKNIDAQIENIFKPQPCQALMDFEVKYLEDFIDSVSNSPQQKHDKIRRTLEGKIIAQDAEDSLTILIQNIITGEYPDEVKEAILISFRHTQIRKFENIIKLCFEMIRLTENPNYVLSLQNPNFSTDVLEIIGDKLGQSFNGSLEGRKWSCLIILGYLEGMISEKKQLQFDHVDKLLDELKHNGYDEFGDLGAGFTPERIKETIDHYLLMHGSTLKARFQSKSPFGRRRTATEIMEQMEKSFPKNMLNK